MTTSATFRRVESGNHESINRYLDLQIGRSAPAFKGHRLAILS